MSAVLIGLIVAVAVLVGWITLQIKALEAPDVSTVTLGGDRGEIYLHCSGSVSSATLWVSADSTGDRSDSDYEVNGGAYTGLARTVGDTLEFVSQGEADRIVLTRLPYHVKHRRLDATTFGVHPNKLFVSPPAGYTVIHC